MIGTISSGCMPRAVSLGVLMLVGPAVAGPPAAAYEWRPAATVFEYREAPEAGADPRSAATVIGIPGVHVASHRDTLLDIARLHHLGYRELLQANPGTDPWRPGEGAWITLPSQWILPDAPRQGLVLNMPEMRLYHYLPGSRVRTFPLGVGQEGQETPAGYFRIGQKRTDPVWYVPVSIQKEMENPRKTVPPGPDNPLGRYWMRLSRTTYGIHGTNNPWAIGRRVTHGCIRLYPEDIAFLYPRVPKGTPVQVIYQHAKVGVRDGRAYFQIYRDGRATDNELMADLIRQITKRGLAVDLRQLRSLLPELPDGVMIPLPPRNPRLSGIARPERTFPQAPRSRETRRTATADP